jgi:uncharacterized protein YjiS (DUF1127 family)
MGATPLAQSGTVMRVLYLAPGDSNMEMHTPSSLLATHGIVAQPGRPALSRWIKRVPALLSRLRLAIRREREFRRAAAELESFNDHLLADIGICRGDIERVVRGGRLPFWRRAEDTRC